MALVKCRECGHQISTEALACPSCGAPQNRIPPLIPPRLAAPPPIAPLFPQRRTSGHFIKRLFAVGAVIIFSVVVLCIVAWVVSSTRNDPSPSSPPSSAQALDTNDHAVPKDKLEEFISKYGKPDKEDTTAYDNPRPPMVSRFLIYEPEHVRVLCLADTKIGAPPPYSKWMLIGFEDTQDDHVIHLSEVQERLKGRLMP
jgi:hypothetical protein